MGGYILSIPMKLHDSSFGHICLVFEIPSVQFGSIFRLKENIFVGVADDLGVKIEEAIRVVKKVGAGQK